MVVNKDNNLYYINLNNELVKLQIGSQGNSVTKIQTVAFNTIFEIHDDNNYFICNMYDQKKIINISGYNYEWNSNDKIQEYGIHYDNASGNWLFIIQNQRGEFKTFVFNKNKIIFESDQINYSVGLSNLCFNNNTIFIPRDKSIRGFNYQKNVYKDFDFDVVNDDSKLIKDNNKIYVINEQEIYMIG
jgi:hypothetical protein